MTTDGFTPTEIDGYASVGVGMALDKDGKPIVALVILTEDGRKYVAPLDLEQAVGFVGSFRDAADRMLMEAMKPDEFPGGRQ